MISLTSLSIRTEPNMNMWIVPVLRHEISITSNPILDNESIRSYIHNRDQCHWYSQPFLFSIIIYECTFVSLIGIEIFVKTWTGRTITLNVVPSTSINDVRLMIEEKVMIPPLHQVLVYCGRVLQGLDHLLPIACYTISLLIIVAHQITIYSVIMAFQEKPRYILLVDFDNNGFIHHPYLFIYLLSTFHTTVPSSRWSNSFCVSFNLIKFNMTIAMYRCHINQYHIMMMIVVRVYQ
jgi:hypothetical protein